MLKSKIVLFIIAIFIVLFVSACSAESSKIDAVSATNADGEIITVDIHTTYVLDSTLVKGFCASAYEIQRTYVHFKNPINGSDIQKHWYRLSLKPAVSDDSATVVVEMNRNPGLEVFESEVSIGRTVDLVYQLDTADAEYHSEPIAFAMYKGKQVTQTEVKYCVDLYPLHEGVTMTRDQRSKSSGGE